MTPERLKVLLEYLREFQLWLEDTRPGTLDLALVAAVRLCVADELTDLLRGGAR